jgi:hypothetical protein
MKRVLVDLEDSDLECLQRIAVMENASRASILREAVSEYLLREDQNPVAQPKPLEGFGVLKGRFPRGREYQDKLRGEWE